MDIRKFFFDRSIKTKIIGAIVAVLLGVCVFNLIFFPAQQRKLALEGMETKGESMTQMLAYNLSSALDFDDRQSIEKMIKGAFQDQDLSFIKILRYQYNDTLFFEPKKSVQRVQKLIPVPADTAAGAFMDEDQLHIICPIQAGQRTFGVLMLSFSLDPIEKEIAQRRRLIFGLNLLIMVLGIVIADRLSGLLTKPIYKLTGAASKLSQGEWGVQVPVTYSDEIGILASTFNQMSENLKESKEELEKYTRTLEYQVKARTVELEIQTERAVQADQLKSQFLANTSHELRTPLNSIIGFLGLILDGYCNDKEEEKEFLQNAQASAKHLLSLINDVLDIAKIEAGKMELELQDVDLKALFEEVNSLARVQAEQKKLKMSFVCEDEFVPHVYADLGKLKQVMLNLIGNAIKFTDKGSITIRTRVQKDKGNVLIQVEDTGI
jgi:signal transduction histidine kinase